MTVSELLRALDVDGVRLTLTATGAVRAKGPDAAVKRWVTTLRERKAEIVEALGRAHLTEPPDPVAALADFWRSRGRNIYPENVAGKIEPSADCEGADWASCCLRILAQRREAGE